MISWRVRSDPVTYIGLRRRLPAVQCNVESGFLLAESVVKT